MTWPNGSFRRTILVSFREKSLVQRRTSLAQGSSYQRPGTLTYLYVNREGGSRRGFRSSRPQLLNTHGVHSEVLKETHFLTYPPSIFTAYLSSNTHPKKKMHEAPCLPSRSWSLWWQGGEHGLLATVKTPTGQGVRGRYSPGSLGCQSMGSVPVLFQAPGGL